MFEPKQSDYWYIEDTDDFLLCTVSSISASSNDPCKQDPVAIYPVIYKINRDTNKKKTLFPSGSAQLDSFLDPGYVNTLVPDVSSNINVSEISKPQISFNKTNSLYSITFTGKYSDNDFAIFSYIFQYNSSSMHLVDSYAFIPEAKNYNVRYTFDNGNLHPDYIIKGNTTSNTDTFFGTGSSDFLNYVPPDYQIAPFHFGNDLKFGSTVYSTTSTEYSGDGVLPISYSGGFITLKDSANGISTENCIRVDFNFKCYSLTNQQGFWSDVTVTGPPLSASRNTTLYTLNTSDYLGEGFCIFFYEPQTEIFPIYVDSQNSTGIGYQDIVGIGNSIPVTDDPKLKELELNGVGKTMGYVPASANVVEYNSLSPFRSQGIRAKGFLAICFDLAGYFCTTDEGMPGSYDGTTYTQSASTIGIRGGDNNGYKVLGRASAASVATIPMHEWVASASAATYKYFRVELIKGGTFVKILGKSNEGDSFTQLYSLDLKDYYTEIPKQLKAGLTFNTTTRIANFELNKFKVEGLTDESNRISVITSSTPIATTDRRYDTSISSGAIEDCIYQSIPSGTDNCIYSLPITQVSTQVSTTQSTCCTCCC